MTNEIINLFDGFPSLFDTNFPQQFFKKGGSWDSFYTKDPFPYDVVVKTDKDGNGVETELVYAVAGVDKDDIKVRVENNTLEINIFDTTDKNEQEPLECPFSPQFNDRGQSVHYVHKGISRRRMKKVFTLGGGLDKDNITSKLDNGLLTVIIPHIPRADSKVIHIA